MSLDDPTSKMSKSAENPLSRISLLDEEGKIKKAIMKATTDSEGRVHYDVKNKPGISNLMTIYSVFSGKTISQVEKLYDGRGYGDFKKELVELTIDSLRPIRERYESIRHSQELLDYLLDGAQRANEVAENTMKRVRENFGLGSR